MLQRLVAASLHNRLVVVVFTVLVCILGTRALLSLSIDAFPDTTPVQVQINTVAAELSPEEIEFQITFPVETAISGIPGLSNVRSVSKFGFSQVVATFEDGTSIYDARQLVLERINSVNLPQGIERPTLGPIATGLGEVFHYILHSPSRSLEELRTLHDWVVRPELRRVPGVAEVNSWGGHERQYQVVYDPRALVAYKLILDDLVGALQRNNRNVGGGRIVESGQDLLVHGIGRIDTVDDIANVVVATRDGVPVHVHDVAEVRVGHQIRRGAVTANGSGEAVLGLGFMLMGENSAEVSRKLRHRLDTVRASLPNDVQIDIVYDRTSLVDEVITTVRHNLLFGAVLVIVVLFLLFGSLRAGIVIALTIPLSMLLAALGMHRMAIAASLLSLGAIDFGIIVDGAVVMAENNLRRLGEKRHLLGRALTPVERIDIIASSSREVVRPVFFGVMIITLVLVPVLALQGTEGKLFQPMVLTLIFALVGGLLVAVFLTPALSLWMLPRMGAGADGPRDGRVMVHLRAAYDRVLNVVMRFRHLSLVMVQGMVVAVAILAFSMGSEFVPRLSEGSIVLNVVRLAGISIEESVAYNTNMERALIEAFPDEIAHVWSRIGTAEVATDPMGTELTDIFITLHPRSQWRAAGSQEELVSAMEKLVSDLPGQTVAYTQPIEMRINEMAAGIRSDLGIKIYGDDFDLLSRISDDIQLELNEIDGTTGLSGEQLTGQPVLRVQVDTDAIARLGVQGDHVLETAHAVGGIPAGEIQAGQLRFPLVVRLPDAVRTDPGALAGTLVPTAAGAVVPLETVADLVDSEGPATIQREWGRRRTIVQTNVRGRDIASYVDEVQRRIVQNVDLPVGYTIEFGGQFENLERANERFRVLVPLTLALVFFLLYMSLRRFGDALIVFTGIPLACIGGVLALWMRGMPFSVSAIVGFIALCGIAVLNGQVLITTARRLIDEGMGVAEAAREAGRVRLRPVLATAITDAAGFLPMAISTGVGAEVQRPLATVIIGGVLTSTLLTLFVLPLVLDVSRNWRSAWRWRQQEARSEP
jgi:cobalt-zinc-cadmium resistance protein CzcA